MARKSIYKYVYWNIRRRRWCGRITENKVLLMGGEYEEEKDVRQGKKEKITKMNTEKNRKKNFYRNFKINFLSGTKAEIRDYGSHPASQNGPSLRFWRFSGLIPPNL